MPLALGRELGKLDKIENLENWVTKIVNVLNSQCCLKTTHTLAHILS
jgi:hypothetical protein